MAINVGNFIKGSLRAALSISSNTLQLNTGGGARFAFTAGDYCYIILYDRSSYEIVLYTSTGSVSNDNITVVRGQDGTVAKAFPAGTCYEVAWNVEQLNDYVSQLVEALFPTLPLPEDTQAITSGTPTLAPATGIIYTVNTTNGYLWYWTGTVWLLVSGSGSSSVVTVGGAPPGTVTTPFWLDNTTPPGVLYVAVAGTYVQVNAHRTSAFTGVKTTAGTLDVYGHYQSRGGYHYFRRIRSGATQTFAAGASALVTYTANTSFNDDVTTHPNPLTSSGSDTIVITYACVVRIYGQIELDNKNLYTRNTGFFTLTPTPAGLVAITGEAFYEPGGTDNSVRVNIVSPPIYIATPGTQITMTCVDAANVHSNDILSASLTVEIVGWA